MDKLAEQLRLDAEQIDAQVSAQLDERIRASLESASQQQPKAPAERPSTTFWWASSLTGIAATLLVIAIVNLSSTEPEPGMTQPPPGDYDYMATRFDRLKLKDAVSTQTLQQELVDIQTDLRKAEQALRDDIEQLGVDTTTE